MFQKKNSIFTDITEHQLRELERKAANIIQKVCKKFLEKLRIRRLMEQSLAKEITQR